MNNSTAHSHDSLGDFGGAGLGRVAAMCKQILNNMAKTANRPNEHRRFAALPLRQLEDIGMTVAERDAQLRWTEPTAAVFPEIFLRR